jgi:hypothetical protein
MFSHLGELQRLTLNDNTCVNKEYEPAYATATIENDLAVCGTGYAKHEQENLGAR